VTIRPAVASDAGALSDLSGQLGYPSTVTEIATRLEGLAARGNNLVLVAEDAGRVIGWIGVRSDLSLETGPFAEIVGLVVSEHARGKGVGESLVAAALEWAKERGHVRVRVRSNVVRERAHRFYERNGYEHYKTQKSFRKPL